MTNDEVIKLAREAGDDLEHTLPHDKEFLLRFAALVAAATRDEISMKHDLQQALSEINELVRSVEEAEKRGQE